MKSSELADIVEEKIRAEYSFNDMRSHITEQGLDMVITLCREGIMGPGKEQYERDGRQKFEDMPLVDLVGYVKEESRDLINYGVMVTWRMDQISLALVELSRRSQVQELVAEGKIIGVIRGTNLSALADCMDCLTDTLAKSDQPTS